MSHGIPNPWVTVMDSPRGTLPVTGIVAVGAFRLPSDALFYSTMVLKNIVGGSRYRVIRADNGDEVVAGLASGEGLIDLNITGIPVYSNPMLVHITVRNASGFPAYKVFDTSAFIRPEGVEVFIFQQPDE